MSKVMQGTARLLSIAFAAAALAGCASYYAVTDPSSKSTYYTQEIEKEGGGAISFLDAKTNSQVTLQSSEVKEISGDEWKQAVGKR